MIGGVTVRLQSKARELAPKVPNVLAGSTAVDCDGELVLGINGAGYDFYSDHWSKLYDALGYHWHTPVEPT